MPAVSRLRASGVKLRRATGSRSLSLQIALRYLRSTRKDAFVSFLAAAASCGIALGVGALVLALAALSGFQGALRDEIIGRTPELEITLGAAGSASSAGELVRAIDALPAADGYRLSAQRLLEGRGWLLARGGVRTVRLVAFDETLPATFPGPTGREQGLYVGSSLAEQWGLKVGEVVEVASGRPTLTPIGPQPRVLRLPIAGIFASGRTESEDRLAVPWAAGEKLIGSQGLRVVVASGSLDRVDQVVARLAPILPPTAEVRSWRELNRALLFALRLEKSLMFLAVFLIVVVAVLALVSGLFLILASKRREVGMLRAMGATPKAVRDIFLWLAAILAGLGTVAGFVLGAAAAWALDHWRLLSLPDQVYFLDYVPFQVQATDSVLVLAACLGLTLGCAMWAASRAAKLRPIEALRR